MLYLSRKPGEAVVINHSIEVRVIEVRGRTVKLGFTFPADVTVLREEVVEAIKRANRAAADAVRALPAGAPGRAAPGGEPAPDDPGGRS